MGHIFNIYLSGHLERSEQSELNQAIIDQMSYDSRWFYDVPIESMLSDGAILCKEPSGIEHDVYYFRNFYELWIIYSAGLFVCLVENLLTKFMEYFKRKRGDFWYTGIRGQRDK